MSPRSFAFLHPNFPTPFSRGRSAAQLPGISVAATLGGNPRGGARGLPTARPRSGPRCSPTSTELLEGSERLGGGPTPAWAWAPGGPPERPALPGPWRSSFAEAEKVSGNKPSLVSRLCKMGTSPCWPLTLLCLPVYILHTVRAPLFSVQLCALTNVYPRLTTINMWNSTPQPTPNYLALPLGCQPLLPPQLPTLLICAL